MQIVTEGRYNHLYGGEYRLKTGMDISREQLFERLRMLDYRLGEPLLAAGVYRLEENSLVIRPWGEDYTSVYTITLQGSFIKGIFRTTSLATPLASLYLGRPQLTSYLDSIREVREVQSFSAIPDHLVQAVLIAEDNRFFDHPGVDFIGIGRAAVINLKNRAICQGGSTITQQLIKTFLQRNERTFSEKIVEAIMALHLEWLYSKEKIMETYLNNVYMGHVGPFSLQGVGAAARYYFGKDLEALQPGESAMLAVMIRSPNKLSPRNSNHHNLVRAVAVLQDMKQQGILPKGYMYDPFAVQDDVGKKEREKLLAMAWVYAECERELRRYDSPLMQAPDGKMVEISIDPVEQDKAAVALEAHLEELEGRATDGVSLQGAVVMLEQQTGGIKAMVGGRDYLKSQFNRASMAARPVGSLVKPFVYLAAMEPGIGFTPQTLLADTPLRLKLGKGVWRPHNFDNRYKGSVTLENALVTSRNIPAVRAGLKASVSRVAGLVKSVGINEKPQTYPSLFLGSCLSTPLRIAAAYGALAQGGKYVQPQLIDRVVVDGTVVVIRRPRLQQVLDSALCRTMTGMLEKVLTSGTGRSARRWGVGPEVAGKTGTTNGFRDAWFAGYSDDVTTVVWVGNDDNKSIKMTGAKAALPVWAQLMGNSSLKQPEVVPEQQLPPQLVKNKSDLLVTSEFVAAMKPPVQQYLAKVARRETTGRVRAKNVIKQLSVKASSHQQQPLVRQKYKYFQ